MGTWGSGGGVSPGGLLLIVGLAGVIDQVPARARCLPSCSLFFSEDFSKDFSVSASSLDEVLFPLRSFLELLGDNLDMMLPLGKVEIKKGIGQRGRFLVRCGKQTNHRTY